MERPLSESVTGTEGKCDPVSHVSVLGQWGTVGGKGQVLAGAGFYPSPTAGLLGGFRGHATVWAKVSSFEK